MRRISIALVLLISCISSITAAYVGVNPSVGGFNIDMASWDYQGGTEWNIVHSGGNDTYPAVTGDSTASRYSYEQMVGTGGVYEMDVDYYWFVAYIYEWDTAESNYPLTITASCPNGFYFVSSTNEAARRPFRLKVVVNASHSYDTNNPGTGQFDSKVYTLQDGNNSVTVDYWDDFDTGRKPYSSAEDETYYYQFLWFDVVLELPIDSISNTGTLIADNRQYNLVEADDYNALVTLSVDWNGQHREVVIPLSGYYSINEGKESMASLVVRPRAAASNLDIKNMAGDPQTVADIDFMSEIYSADYEKYRNGVSDPTASNSSYRIFLSASNDPLSPDSTFLLEHSSRSPLDAPSPYNTIEYTATLRGYDGPLSDSNRRYLTETFYGNEAISGANVPGVLVESGSHSNTGGDIQYAQFTGSIDVTISEPDTPIMQQGRYVDEIYIHVISTGG